jgi:hypothetical protein
LPYRSLFADVMSHQDMLLWFACHAHGGREESCPGWRACKGADGLTSNTSLSCMCACLTLLMHLVLQACCMQQTAKADSAAQTL